MAVIIRIQINNKEIRCYGITRITNTGVLHPTGKESTYKITECYSGKLIGYLRHNYDDSPEKLVIKAMKLVG